MTAITTMPIEVIDLDPMNPLSIIEFGSKIQTNVSDFADKVLGEVQAKDMEEVGVVMTDLMSKCRSINTKKMVKRNTLMKLPIIGGLFSKGQNILAKYEKIGNQVETITEKLNNAKTQILADINILEELYEKNMKSFQELEQYIQVGNAQVEKLGRQIAELQKKPEAINDQVKVQEVQNLMQIKERLEKKVHDLELSKMIALQTAPQIKLIQGNNNVLAEKIQSSVLNTIPLWKNQLIIVVTLSRQKHAMDLQKKVSDTTNDLLLANAELMKQGSVGIAREAERGIVDISTLEEVNSKLISSLNEIETIRTKGKADRQSAKIKMVELQNELKQRLSK